jgi:uncharacterized membrane protein
LNGGGDFLTRIEKSIEISAPPENVWQAIQPENTPQWFEQFKRVEWTSSEIHKKGSTFRVSSYIAGSQWDFDAKMDEVKDNQQGIWHTTSGNIKSAIEADLRPVAPGTKLSMSMVYKLPYGVVGRMFDRIRMHKEVDMDFEVGLQDLKYILEK